MAQLSRRQTLMTLGACLALGSTTPSAAQAALGCGILDLPPWILNNTSQRGFGCDMVAVLSQRTIVPIEPVALPITRLMRDFVDGRLNLAMFTPHPELAVGGRVLGRLGMLRMGILLRPGLSVADIAEMKGRLIGHVRSAARLPALTKLVDLDRVEVSDVGRGIDMLRAARLDGYFGAQLAIDWVLRQKGLDHRAFGEFLLLETHPYQLHASNAAKLHPEIERLLIGACAYMEQQYDSLVAAYTGQAS